MADKEPDYGLSGVCFGLAVVLVLAGFFVMYVASQEVGGDAYNLIIAATRGVGLIAAGGVVALVGVGSAVRALIRETAEPITLMREGD